MFVVWPDLFRAESDLVQRIEAGSDVRALVRVTLMICVSGEPVEHPTRQKRRIQRTLQDVVGPDSLGDSVRGAVLIGLGKNGKDQVAVAGRRRHRSCTKQLRG